MAELTSGGSQVGMIVVLVLLGAALVGAVGPLIAPPLAQLERRRLRMVDPRPVGTNHRKAASAGPVSWLRSSYTDPATWCEVGYACLLGTAAPVLSIAALLAAPLTATFLVSRSWCWPNGPAVTPSRWASARSRPWGRHFPT